MNKMRETIAYTYYDNSPSSITFFKGRTNTLRFNDRNIFEIKETKCLCCDEEY